MSRKTLILFGGALALLLGVVVYAIFAPGPPGPPLEKAWLRSGLVTHAQAQSEYEADRQKTEAAAAQLKREAAQRQREAAHSKREAQRRALEAQRHAREASAPSTQPQTQTQESQSYPTQRSIAEHECEAEGKYLSSGWEETNPVSARKCEEPWEKKCLERSGYWIVGEKCEPIPQESAEEKRHQRQVEAKARNGELP